MTGRNPVVTGTGIVCAAGLGMAEVWEAIRAGRSGLGPLGLFHSARYPGHPAGQVRHEVNALAKGVRGSRSDKLAWIAARQALEGAGLAGGLDPVWAERVGVVVGSTVGGMLGTEDVLAGLLRRQRHRFGPLRHHECAGVAESCAVQSGARGPCLTLSTACSAGAMALAVAARLIEEGEADIVLTGGSDSLCRLTWNGFGSLLLLDPGGCRPFDARRAGISLGEGAGMLVLEAAQTAQNRGAQVLARLSGWGASCDAWHATAPHPEGRGALAAMEQALQRGGLRPADIDYICAHGTGTPDNDAMEAKALRKLFGDGLPPVSSVKRFFGHTLAASGALKAVVCVRALQEQMLPPNPGFDQPDSALNLEPVRTCQPRRLDHVLSNSFGFGGNNVALVFSRREPVSATTDAGAGMVLPAAGGRKRLAVVRSGIVSAAGSSLEAVREAFARQKAPLSLLDVPAAQPAARARVYGCGEFGAPEVIESGRRRRLNRLQQMAVVAARRSAGPELAAAGSDKVCVVIGTGLGALNDTAAFVENMILKNESAPRAALFSNSVHNALASQVAIELDLRGLNSTPVQREITFEAALWQGADEVRRGSAGLALVGAADELNPYWLAAETRWGWWDESTPEIRPFHRAPSDRQRALAGEGCGVFALTGPERAPNPLAWVTGIRLGQAVWTADGRVDAVREARWIAETMRREGLGPAEVDLLLTGANGWNRLDQAYLEVVQELGRLSGRVIASGAYKHVCGEYASASAFGFFTAIGLVRGEIEPSQCLAMPSVPDRGRPCHLVVLYTLSATGAKAMCCVCA